MLITGAGGFAKELLSVIVQNNELEEVVFYDDTDNGPDILFGKYRVLKNSDAAYEYFQKIDNRFVLGIGKPIFRKQMSDKFKLLNGKLSNVIAPLTHIGEIENSIGEGATIMNNVIIEIGNTIGIGCLLHHAVFISHDITIGSYCELSPSATILGNVQIGDYCTIGAGAVLLPKVKLGNYVVVGAGAVVTKNVPDSTLVVGVPAKSVKQLLHVSI